MFVSLLGSPFPCGVDLGSLGPFLHSSSPQTPAEPGPLFPIVLMRGAGGAFLSPLWAPSPWLRPAEWPCALQRSNWPHLRAVPTPGPRVGSAPSTDVAWERGGGPPLPDAGPWMPMGKLRRTLLKFSFTGVVFLRPQTTRNPLPSARAGLLALCVDLVEEAVKKGLL